MHAAAWRRTRTSFTTHRPGVYLDMCCDQDMQERILETIPRFRVMFRDCDSSRRTVEIKGLNFDMRESQFMERFCCFRRKLLPWGHNGLVGIQFIYQSRSTMYSNRDAETVEGGDVKVFHGRVYIAFLNEYLADLFRAQFDGWYGGDMMQFEKYKYT